jgi:hypothetical protein
MNAIQRAIYERVEREGNWLVDWKQTSYEEQQAILALRKAGVIEQAAYGGLRMRGQGGVIGHTINPAPAIWYAPAEYPDIETDATVLDGDGELLLVTNGWQYKIISTRQITRIVDAKNHESVELLDMEREDYEGENQN